MTSRATVAPSAPSAPSAVPADAIWLGNLHPALRRCWHPVARLADVAGQTEVRLLGETWVLTLDTASGWRAEGPGGVAAATATHLGMVWVAPDTPLPPLPSVPELDDPSFVAVPAPPWDWSAGAGQMTDGACDITHLPFLHRSTIGNPDEVIVPPYEVTVDVGSWTARVAYSHTARALYGGGAILPRHVVIEHTAPFSVRLRLEHPCEDAVVTSMFLHQPTEVDRTRLWCINFRTDIADGRCTPEEATALHRRVNDEDRRMLERYPRRELPLDLREEVHVRPDRITVEVRRSLLRLVLAAAGPQLEPGTR